MKKLYVNILLFGIICFEIRSGDNNPNNPFSTPTKKREVFSGEPSTPNIFVSSKEQESRTYCPNISLGIDVGTTKPVRPILDFFRFSHLLSEERRNNGFVYISSGEKINESSSNKSSAQKDDNEEYVLKFGSLIERYREKIKNLDNQKKPKESTSRSRSRSDEKKKKPDFKKKKSDHDSDSDSVK